MDVSEILKQQQAALETLQQHLAKPDEAGLISLLGDHEQQIAAIQARIDDLTRQRDATIRRYDAAIEEQKKALTALRNVIANTGRILQGIAPSAATKTNDTP
jgi:hypothetical protein